jgi:hypothetical protein
MIYLYYTILFLDLIALESVLTYLTASYHLRKDMRLHPEAYNPSHQA